MTESRARNFVSNVNNHTLHDFYLSIKRRRHVKNEVIKNNLECVFPSTKNVTNTNVFQTRVRRMRLLPMLLEKISFKEFEEKVGKSNVANFDVDLETQNDEACQVASEIWLDLLNDNEVDNADSTL